MNPEKFFVCFMFAVAVFFTVISFLDEKVNGHESK